MSYVIFVSAVVILTALVIHKRNHAGGYLESGAAPRCPLLADQRRSLGYACPWPAAAYGECPLSGIPHWWWHPTQPGYSSCAGAPWADPPGVCACCEHRLSDAL